MPQKKVTKSKCETVMVYPVVFFEVDKKGKPKAKAKPKAKPKTKGKNSFGFLGLWGSSSEQVPPSSEEVPPSSGPRVYVLKDNDEQDIYNIESKAYVGDMIAVEIPGGLAGGIPGYMVSKLEKNKGKLKAGTWKVMMKLPQGEVVRQ